MTDVTHPELVKALVKDPMAILSTLNVVSVDLWHGATGVAGETGELLEGIMGSMNFANSEQLEAGRVNLMEELGDIYFYQEQIVQRTGIELDWDSIANNAGLMMISPDMMLHYACIIAVRGSQVLDTVKKMALYNKPLDVLALKVQLTDMSTYCMAIGYMFGIARGMALEGNIAKLKVRYEGLKYSDGAAQARADKQPERKFIKGEQEPRTGDMADVVEAERNAG